MKIIKKICFIFQAFILATGLYSCVDDNIDYRMEEYDPSEDPEMVCLPFNLNYDYTVSTREGESDGTDTDTTTSEGNSGFVDGSGSEHAMDFEINKECFAIFFGPDKNDNNKVKFKYLKRLYISDQLGKGGKEEGSKSEFSVPVVCYIPKSDCTPVYADGDTERVNPLYWTPNLLNVLVVLNGGPVYDTLHKKLYDIQSDGTYKAKELTINDILAFTWDNPADYDHPPFNNDRLNDDDYIGEIGKNKYGHYTMTSSAYWEKKGQVYNLMTASPITGKAYDSIKKFKESGDEPTSTVYVERMLAKFSAPTFETAVIGSNRVFRPDQNAMALVVYSWNDKDEPVSIQKNWRIHLIGWAINGTESQSYIFKNIGNVGLGSIENIPVTTIENEKYIDWNIQDDHRSYWTVDPHYSSDQGSFYPWQFRKAADRKDIISVQAGLHYDTDKATAYRIPVLRYKTFRDLLEKTDWQPIRYVPENTYDPEGSWDVRFNDDLVSHPDEERESNPEYLDGRASLLAGPHLIMGGELYLEDAGEDYVVTGTKFGKVDHIYADRLRRFYRTEVDWFKMFVTEINKTLEAQESMSFTKYNWDEGDEEKTNPKIIISPEGSPRLFLDGKQLTFAMIDELAEDPEIKFSHVANIRNGDGRLIPWIEVTKEENGQEKTLKLEVRLTQDGRVRTDASGNIMLDKNKQPLQKKAGDLMFYTEEGSSDLLDTWDDDLYKSLFYEWFGPIDHYNQGYMYYAGPIMHREVLNGTNFYGTVRNHWYKFHVRSINSLGVPIDNPDQIIIPGNYNYNDQIIVHMDVIGWHSKPVIVDIL